MRLGADREHDGGWALMGTPTSPSAGSFETADETSALPTNDMLSFRRATSEDAQAITDLVNSAYRGETSKQGWTTEADLLDGLRTTPLEIKQIISAQDSFFLLCHRDAMLVGSVHIKKQGNQAYIGMFVVRPDIQGVGIGKRLLQKGETLAWDSWEVNSYAMIVITSRHELIAFYERRGYRRTGEFCEFPVNPELWTPKVGGLKMERLEKRS
jgi:ribosomal protein S18 acetylase RimI-like enzyme